MSSLTIAMAQINPLVGDIAANTARILDCSVRAYETYSADIVVFPELCITGYPPEDLLLRPSLSLRVEESLKLLKESALSYTVVVGYPKLIDGRLYNMAGVITDGELVHEYAKQCLPNYQVFDEKRYFAEGTASSVFSLRGVRVALTICEDIWNEGPAEQAAQLGADLLINLNASPFHVNKFKEREALVSRRSRALGLPIIYVNQVGGQDELVFDGASFATDVRGDIMQRAAHFSEDTSLVIYDPSAATKLLAVTNPFQFASRPVATVYSALVLGVKDYVNKNGFKRVVLGLSGGIDSALTLAIAVDALGAERVEAVMMPFLYTSDMSKNDAAEEARLLGVKYRVIDIASIYEAFIASLDSVFGDLQKDTTEENLQARTRGVILMALSNKLGYLVLTTGNKSEMAVGYATLYGDMAGGFDVLKDVPKTLVYALSEYRNSLGEAIPPTVISRPPSAELAPDQKDQDSLPDYEVLDKILEMYIEQDMSAEAIIGEGFKRDEVLRVLRLVDLNEYKRRQAPIGVRISKRAFGRDRRYPITNGWKLGN
ncbi:MAG: NAD+ synthase [Cellvibrionaceae bacterium]|nr:NAD+ synthase [Cellvibrionaceae bacterium]